MFYNMLKKMGGVLNLAAPTPGVKSIARITIKNADAASSALPVSGALPVMQETMPGRSNDWSITVNITGRNNFPVKRGIHNGRI